MRTHLSRRIRLAAATGVAVVVLALVGAVGLRFLVGTASADPAAPNPGHPWSQVENHGIDAAGWWLGAGADQALELRLNGARVLRLEPTSFNVIGGYSGNSVTAGAGSATIGGGGSSDSGANRVTDHCGTVSGGVDNQAGNGGAVDDQVCATVGGGAHNTASTNMSTVGGGASNTASSDSATVAGGAGNIASGQYATVGGGSSNTASGDNATVGGGGVDQAPGQYATVGGGNHNWAPGDWATIGGGNTNTASGPQSTVAGGATATASGAQSSVGGGSGNVASGGYSTVPGGKDNLAQGDYSFSAGRQAKAHNAGCFLWADSQPMDIACDNNDRFIARASGGVYLYTNSALTSGTFLAAGSSSWSTVSARDLKENFTPADGQEVLARVAEIPMSTWNYKAQDASIRHMGPMAQDFYAAFGLGENNTSISTVDADGVALASIQGLYELVQQKDADIAALKARVDALEQAGGGSAVTSQASSSGPPTRWLLAGVLALGALALVQRQFLAGRRQKS